MLAVAAQLKLTVPGLPVPVTGQTFALALIAGLGGPRVAVAGVAVYVTGAALGLGILSGGRGGWDVVTGPSMGYLVGFFGAALTIPALLRRWGRRKWVLVWLAIEAGSACVLGCGALGLMVRGLSLDQAVLNGIWPYLPGDLIKSATAATLLWLAARR